MEELAGPNLTIDQCVELAGIGATIELCAMTCIGKLASRPVADLVACVRAVGVERCTLATDYGQAVNPHPAEGLQLFADALVAEGLSEADVRTMACTNPCALLGLDSVGTLSS
jgi:imidazolonepropionase-like amidohydrolase